MVDLDLERASEIIFVYKLGKPDQEDLRLRIEAQILDQEVTRFARAKTHQCTISYIAEDIQVSAWHSTISGKYAAFDQEFLLLRTLDDLNW